MAAALNNSLTATAQNGCDPVQNRCRPLNELLIIADSALMGERTRWLDTLAGERRLSPKTLDAYERDTRQFLTFLTGHVGGPAGLADVETLRPADLRSFLAARRKDGAGNRSLGRNLAGIRSFIRYLERKGLANAAGASAVRSPKQPKSLPKPLTDIQALRVVADETQLAEEPWIAARNAAVLSLLYGCGLRISEALDLLPADFAGAPETLRILGKGNKTRIVPLLPVVRQAVEAYRAACPYDLPADEACFAARVAENCSPASSSARCSACAARSACRKRRRRMRCAIPSPPICWPAAATCAPSRNCSAMPACRPRRSIPASIPAGCSKPTTAPIRAPDFYRILTIPVNAA